ncbi:DNA-binding PadR family transcriptional regulator [Arthrobacter silviterrae]|uniref:PadR family transcriptional regulator n=1 Tax=Arthrobacter silviterrae TaxID=2026658 RepID=A0ABX0DIK7_9MICC|nr:MULTISPECIES: PadR family transcriptional regulator [Arthrobacter]MCU6482712.1 PadR family transcriptional regulator [Arthrobacter sp. A2-55]MDQ0277762.1 DNA-binding PadR family transcriptional regulator [Arthrobacter silviterrae]NGN85566.1 PadR family transcriptional regulator [Arthrobacter silviterrae]
MDSLPRITGATVDVLEALLASRDQWGLLIIKETGRPPGTVYPILDRLESAGWVTSAWESSSERPGPRRRFYALTADGRAAAVDASRKFRAKASPSARTAPRPVGLGT